MEWILRDAHLDDGGADVAAAHTLVRDLARFEKAEAEVETRAEEFARHASGTAPVLRMLLAENRSPEAKGRIDGLACYGWQHSTWKGRILYLDDLMVREGLRGQGLGTRLLAELARRARTQGVRQMRWQVLDWNTSARALYRNLGAREDAGWVQCHLSAEGIERLARMA